MDIDNKINKSFARDMVKLMDRELRLKLETDLGYHLYDESKTYDDQMEFYHKYQELHKIKFNSDFSWI